MNSFAEDKTIMKEVFSADPEVNEEGEIEHSVILAETGHIDVPSQYGIRYLIMENGRRYVGRPGAADFQVTEFGEYGQRLRERKVNRKRVSKVEGRPTEQLLESDDIRDKAALQWRFSLPLLVPIIALIALALSKTNHRQGRYVKMLPAFLIYIFYIVSLNAARDKLEKGDLPIEVGLWWIHLIFFALALLLLFGGTWWRRLRAPKVG